MFIQLLIMGLIMVQTVAAFIEDMKYILIQENKTGPTSFNSLRVDDVLSCTVVCEDDPLCVIFAFHADRQQCNIYHQLITDSELQHDAGMRMFKIGNIG
ncbi:hypothetical protein SNE40_005523 [Patella caerulea]|uniref:Apple domain-containing protein n=1 Tax=Patella caerulea TaxID=87958 RepID=A0AAN8JX70_PATCE